MTGGLPKYTVEHHEAITEAETVERWDASRQAPVPQPSKEKLRRVLQEETRRAAYTEKRLLNYTKATWDAMRPQGNPTKDMAFFGLDWHAEQRAAARDDDFNFATHRPLTDPETDEPTFLRELAARKSRCRGAGWESGFGKAYTTLGEVPLAPAQVRRRDRPGPLTILGDAWVPEKQVDRGTLAPLQSGVALEKESVPRNGKRFYSIDMIEGRRLDIRLRVFKVHPPRTLLPLPSLLRARVSARV